MKQIKSAYHATCCWLHGLWTGQDVDWNRAYELRMAFYDLFDE